MFSKISAILVVAFAAASASAISNGCNSGPVQCCNNLQQVNSVASAKHYAGLVGVAVGAVTGQASAQCTPITVIGTGTGSACSSQPVCCEHNNFNELVGVNCTPFNAVV